MSESDTRCPAGVENAANITSLEARVGTVERGVLEIRDKLLGRLPNWATIIISMLSALAVGLIVAGVCR